MSTNRERPEYVDPSLKTMTIATDLGKLFEEEKRLLAAPRKLQDEDGDGLPQPAKERAKTWGGAARRW